MTTPIRATPIPGPDPQTDEWYALRVFDPARVERPVVFGASEAGAVLGVSPFSGGPLEIFNRKRRLIPEQESSDAMELGLLLEDPVLTLYALIGWRGFVIAQNAVTAFGRMLASGITVAILVQAAINLCVTTGLMPVTGVTLPLISYGGTSAIITLMMMGILLNISRYRKPAALQVA